MKQVTKNALVCLIAVSYSVWFSELTRWFINAAFIVIPLLYILRHSKAREKDELEEIKENGRKQ